MCCNSNVRLTSVHLSKVQDGTAFHMAVGSANKVSYYLVVLNLFMDNTTLPKLSSELGTTSNVVYYRADRRISALQL